MKEKLSNSKEIRHFHIEKLEIRNIQDTNTRIVGGYVNKYNKNSEVMRDRWGEEFVEVISEGAFTKSLENRNQKALWNHNTDLILGSVISGTLNLFTDNLGLRCEITLPNTSWGNDAYESISRGDVDGMSFGFRCIEDLWSKLEYENREVYKRTILEAELFEVSPCVFPAYSDSIIQCRSLDNFKEINEQREKLRLRNKLYMRG